MDGGEREGDEWCPISPCSRRWIVGVGGVVLGVVLIVYEVGAQQDRWC